MTERLRRFAQRDDLGVRRRIVVELAAIATATDDRSIVDDDHCTDRHIAGRCCGTRFFERDCIHCSSVIMIMLRIREGSNL